MSLRQPNDPEYLENLIAALRSREPPGEDGPEPPPMADIRMPNAEDAIKMTVRSIRRRSLPPTSNSPRHHRFHGL